MASFSTTALSFRGSGHGDVPGRARSRHKHADVPDEPTEVPVHASPKPEDVTYMIKRQKLTRSQKVHLISEDLARAHIRQLRREAAEARLAVGLIKARKAARKAQEAKLHARRALAAFVVD